jgi:hypothetical protein
MRNDRALNHHHHHRARISAFRGTVANVIAGRRDLQPPPL